MSERPAIPRPDDFRYRTEIEVRFRDLDAMRHVNNAVYATYFEMARFGYVSSLEPIPPGVDPISHFPFIMLDIYCRYVAQAAIGDVVVAHVRTTTVGTKSFVLEYLLTRKADGAVLATGYTTLVWFDYASQRTMAVAPRFRALLERYEGRTLGA